MAKKPAFLTFISYLMQLFNCTQQTLLKEYES